MMPRSITNQIRRLSLLLTPFFNRASNRISRGLLLGLLVLTSTMAQGQTLQNINWFAGADIVGTTGDTNAGLYSDFYVREFEFSAYSDIDQTFEGVLTLAYHKELQQETSHLEVHEALLFSGKLLDLATVKIGKFFLGFGRLNRFHRHDWIMTDAPLVQKAFFGNEGAKDTGIEYKRNLLGLNSTFTLGLTSGREFNHTHGHNHENEQEHGNERAKSPTGYLRWAHFSEFSTTEGFELGVNFINRVDSEAQPFQYVGADFIYKDRVGKMNRNLVQVEAWIRKTHHEHDDGEKEEETDSGTYAYYERGLDQHHAYSLRADYFKPAHKHSEDEYRAIDGLLVKEDYKAISIAYNYTNSEFMRFRFTVEHGQGVVTEKSDNDRFTRAFAQLVFNIGAHPAHVY